MTTYELPAIENLTPDRTRAVYRLTGDRDRMGAVCITARMLSDLSDIIRIDNAPFSHRVNLHNIGCTWRSDLRCWVIRVTPSVLTWLVRYLTAQGATFDLPVKLLLERVAEEYRLEMERAA